MIEYVVFNSSQVLKCADMTVALGKLLAGQ